MSAAPPSPSDVLVVCASCSATLVPGGVFCESCGAPVHALSTPTSAVSTPPLCTDCSGVIADDGFCERCGARARDPRDHSVEVPAPWVAGCCDRGIQHSRNEDAMAMRVDPAGRWAVLVVCDGVTSAPHSDRASRDASGVAANLLAGTASAGGDLVASMHQAASVAQAAAVAVARGLGDPPEPPSSTFVAAVIQLANQPASLTVGWCGDSRAYWLPDSGQPLALTVDHSIGTERMRAGMSRAEAERDPSFHTITRWLGADSHDPHAEVVVSDVVGPGWLVVCSDGLWNYASAPEAMAACVADRLAGRDPDADSTPRALSVDLIAWANDQGGHDNITATVARCR